MGFQLNTFSNVVRILLHILSCLQQIRKRQTKPWSTESALTGRIDSSSVRFQKFFGSYQITIISLSKLVLSKITSGSRKIGSSAWHKNASINPVGRYIRIQRKSVSTILAHQSSMRGRKVSFQLLYNFF